MSLSIRRVAILAVLAVVPTSACTDPDKRFDDFQKDVVDAAVVVRADATPVDVIPDVTGQFLFGMAASVSPDPPFLFIGDIVFDASGPTISLSLTPLHRFTREPVGDAPFDGSAAVNSGGQFTSDFSGIIPPDANVLTGSQLTVDGEVLGTIKNVNLFCGEIGGALTAPVMLDLTGTTFAAIRVAPGTTGDDLPDVVIECPDDTPADAGVPDATPPDAAAPDAATPDATTADATPV